jgi:hypothetical protein
MIKNVNINGKKNMFRPDLIESCIENNTCIENDTPKQVLMTRPLSKRASCEKWNLPECCFAHSYQMTAISKLYLNVEDESVDHRSIIIKELTHKMSGYKRQDIDKRIYDKELFVSLEDIIDKLLCSKLKCFYCKHVCELLYENIYSKLQWTLDRIDNNAGHNVGNVVVCCLECNLKKGTMDSARFKYGKQLTFTKKMES